MWTKTNKSAESSLFVDPSTGASHMEIGGYFKYHHMATRLSEVPSAASTSSSTGSCVSWKANSARRRRFEPFCSPAAPHIPIRQRLSSRRCTSVDAGNEADQFVMCSSNPYLAGRRRRMSLLQTLRYQNKQLSDSAFDCPHNAGNKSERDISPTGDILPHHSKQSTNESPPPSQFQEELISHKSSNGPSALSFSKLKAKTKALFAKRSISEKKSPMIERRYTASDTRGGCYPNDSLDRSMYSRIDFSAKERNRSLQNAEPQQQLNGHRQWKSPAITNDSGRGSQARLYAQVDAEQFEVQPGRQKSERRETVAIIERSPFAEYAKRNEANIHPRRSISCPQLGLNLRIYHEIFRRAMSMRNQGNSPEATDSEAEDDDAEEDEFDYPVTPRTGKRSNRQQRTNNSEMKGDPSSPKSEKSEEAEGIVQREEIKFAERMMRNSSPLTAADYLVEKRLQMRVLGQKRQQYQQSSLVNGGATNRAIITASTSYATGVPDSPIRSAFPTRPADSVHTRTPIDDELNNHEDMSGRMERVTLNEVDDARSTPTTHASEEFDEDDNASTILLDQYLPILSELCPRGRNRSQRSSSQSSAVNRSEEDDDITTQIDGKVGSVTQTDLSLIRISEQLSAYLTELGLNGADDEQHFLNDKEGMNFLAKHFFEYQSFVNLPHRAVQLHKTPPSQAGSDPSAAWAPKSMNRAGKNQAAPGARANRNNMDTRPTAHRHGRAGKHEYREWGDRHGELKPEKIAPHKDAWTKFLANEESTGKRTIFECDFEDRILQTESGTLPERLPRAEKGDDLDLSLAFPEASNPAAACEAEVLTILTYAPQVQFVTATVKKAKGLPYNHHPFARVMLFEGRRLLEQKQTTITPATSCNGCISTGSAHPKVPYSNSSTSSSSVSSASNKNNDAIFSESFLFHVSPRMLDRCHIVIEMYDSNPDDLLKGPFPVGHCVVGPMCTGTGCAHWYQMVRKNSLPVCMWHRMTKN